MLVKVLAGALLALGSFLVLHVIGVADAAENSRSDSASGKRTSTHRKAA